MFLSRYNLQAIDPQFTESLQKMKPHRTDSQYSLFNLALEKILNPDHPLVILSAHIDWFQFDDLVDQCYSRGVKELERAICYCILSSCKRVSKVISAEGSLLRYPPARTGFQRLGRLRN